MNKGNMIFKNATTFSMFLVLVWMTVAGVAAQEQVVPVVDGHLGRCSVDFTVRDVNREPMYDAKIDVTIRYGFLGIRKMSLQVGTNGDGKARVAGLPDKDDKTFRFIISSEVLSETVLMNTSDGCKAEYEVILD